MTVPVQPKGPRGGRPSLLDELRAKQQPAKPATDSGREVLVQAGFQPGDQLGEGHCGVVFRDLATGGVVKLTDRLQEAAIARWLMSDLPDLHPGFAKYTSATKLPNPWRHRTAYVVQREELPDVPRLSRHFYRGTEHLENALRKELLARPDTTALARTAESVRSRLEERDVGAFEQLMPILVWARDHGLSLQGLHEHNFGLRGEQLVIRDYTACWPPKAWVDENLTRIRPQNRFISG